MRAAWILGLGVPLIAGGHAAWGAWADLRVDRELSRLGLDEAPAPEPAEVTAGRAELRRLLVELAEFPEPEGYPYLGVRFMVEPANTELLRDGVAERASFFEGLERLPAELWESNGAAFGEGTPRLLQTWRAGGALGARAWLSAQEPGGSASAGRDLARALAIVRVLDDGSSISRMVRRSVVGSAFGHAEDLLVLPAVERDELLAPLAAELAQGPDEPDLRTMIGVDLRWTAHCTREELDQLPWYRAWWERPFAMQDALDELELYAVHVAGPGTLPEQEFRPEASWFDQTLYRWSTFEHQERELVAELRERLEAL